MRRFALAGLAGIAPRWFAAIIAVASIGLAVACSVDEEDIKTRRTGGEAGGSGGGDACSIVKLNGDQTAGGFYLASTYSDIESLIQTNCTSCHTGQIASDLRTFDRVKLKATVMLARMESTGSNVMPPTGKLADADIAKFKQWIDDGMLPTGGGDTASDGAATDGGAATTGTGDAGSDSCGSDPDGGGSGSDVDSGGSEGAGEGGTEGGEAEAGSDGDPENPDVVAALELLENPPELKTCHGQNNAFFRKERTGEPNGYCETDVSYPAGFTCNRAGILTAFKNNSQVKSLLDEYEAAGYFYDQCGERNGKPVVYMACFTNGGADDCTSNLCVKRSAVTSTSPRICAKKFAAE